MSHPVRRTSFVRYALFFPFALPQMSGFFIGLFVRSHTRPGPIKGDSMGKIKQQEHLRPPPEKKISLIFLPPPPHSCCAPKRPV